MHDGVPHSVSSGHMPQPKAPSQVPLKAQVRAASVRQTPGMRGRAPAASGEQTPSRPGKRHESHPLSHRLSQHTSSAQWPLKQSSGSLHFIAGRPLSLLASSISVSFFGPSTTSTAASGSRGGSSGGTWGTVQETPRANAKAVKASRRGVPRVRVAVKNTVVALQSALCFWVREIALLHTLKRTDLNSKARLGAKARRARLGCTL